MTNDVNMRQLFFKMLLAIIGLTTCATANAYDIEVDGVYYNILSITDLTAAVTSGETAYADTVVIPESITFRGKTLNVIKIGSKAFDGCTKLKKVVLPNSIQTIGDDAFSSCKNLVDINFPTSLKNIGMFAYSGCSNLTDLPIAEGLEVIGGYAFDNCTGITEVNIPKSVTSFGNGVFSGCTKVKTVYIPRNIHNLGGCFKEVTGIETIKVETPIPPTCDYISFDKNVLLNATLYIPESALTEYRNADYWKEFFIIEEDSTLGVCRYLKTSSKNSKVLVNGLSGKSKYGFMDGDTVKLKFETEKPFRLKTFEKNGIDLMGEVTDDSSYVYAIHSNDSVYAEYNRFYLMNVSSTGEHGSVYVEGKSIQKGAIFANIDGQLLYNETDSFYVEQFTMMNMHIKSDVGYIVSTKSVPKYGTYSSNFTQVDDSTYKARSEQLNIYFYFNRMSINITPHRTGNGILYISNERDTVTDKILGFGCLYGDTITLKCIPDSGNRLAKLLVDSIDVTENLHDNEYKFSLKTLKTYISIDCYFEKNSLSSIVLPTTVPGNGEVYDIMGRRTNAPTRGIYILRTKDGRTKKIVKR